MKLAFITPTSYLETFSKQGDFYLALAHLIDDEGKNEYAQFHKKEAEKGKRVILDNGLFEGAQVEPEDLIKRAKAIKAHVVCAPDALYDSKGTVKAFKQFIKLKQEEGLVADIMGIPQASNPEDYWECFQFMQLNEDCDMIGLSILSIPKSFKEVTEDADKWPITAPRIHFLKQLSTFQNTFEHQIKPCHLLGLGESYADIYTAIRLLPNTVVSNDSSSTFVHGAKNIIYNRHGLIPGGKIRKKLDFSLPKDSLNKNQLSSVQKNINIANKIKKRRI